MIKMKPLVKITEFTGYISGDGECFCLDKRSRDEELDDINPRTEKEIMKRIKEDEANRLYPDDLFPEECAPIMTDKRGKYKFTIIITAEEVK
jgi:hypothetical protein